MYFLHVLLEFIFRSVETVAFSTSDWSHFWLCHVGLPPKSSFPSPPQCPSPRWRGAAFQPALFARRCLRFEPGACCYLGRDKRLGVNVEEDEIIFRMLSQLMYLPLCFVASGYAGSPKGG